MSSNIPRNLQQQSVPSQSQPGTSGVEQTVSAQGQAPSVVGFGYVCRKDFTPSDEYKAQNPQAIKLSAGDEGKIIEFNQRQSGNHWVKITIPRCFVRGWVPLDCVEVSTVPYGNITVHCSTDAAIRYNPNLSQINDSSSVFEKTATALSLAFATNGQGINFMSNLMQLLISPLELRHFLWKLTEGTKSAGALDILNKPDFTVQDLERKLHEVNTRDFLGQHGIYILIISGFPSDPSRYDIYIGQTNSFSRRLKDHIEEQKNKNQTGTFYKGVSQAMNLKMYKLCDLNRSDHKSIAEQIFMLLLQSYRDEVLNGPPPLSQTYLQTLEADQIQTLQAESQIDHSNATNLTRIAMQCFKETEWPGGVKRQSFGVSRGWNRQSPMCTALAHEQTIWTRTDIPNYMAVFRRVSCTANLIKDSRTNIQPRLQMLRMGSEFNATITVDSTSGLGPGSQFHPVFEIMLNGETHPTPLAPLWSDTLAPWSDWADAKSIGLKFLYQDDQQQWHETPYQYSGLPAQVQPGHVIPYLTATGLRWYFLQQTCSNPPSPKHNFGIARIKQVKFDNLTQQISLQDILDVKVVQSPIPASQITQISELHRLGAKYISNPWNAPQDASRRFCDGCESLSSKQQRNHCPANKRANSCLRCYKRGIPCSMTPNSELRTNIPLRRALEEAKPVDRAFIQIDDPDLVTV